MKLSKRLTALFVAILMVTSIMSSTITTFATSKSGSFYCGSYKVNCSLVSANKYSGMALTNSEGNVNFNTIYAAMFATKVNRQGENPQYISGPGSEKNNYYKASDGIPTLNSGGSYYYARMATAHIGIKNGIENSLSLGVSY